MKKILRFLISRVFWFSLLIVVQIGIFAVILFSCSADFSLTGSNGGFFRS